MAEVVVNVGEKGQILIPKILREQFGILPGQPAILRETEEGLLVKHVEQDMIKFLEEMAKKARVGAKKINLHAIEEQYEERARRAGIHI